MTVMCDTGLAVEVPTGMVLMVYSRSGHGFNHLIRLANSVGVIDSDYRGTIKVRLVCDDPDDDDPPVLIKPGDRVDIEIESIGTLSNPVALEPRGIAPV
jgi:dUTP pyrophosphatase